MSQNSKPTSRKSGLHPRNRHAEGYDFPALIQSCPELAAFVRPAPTGSETIDFANPSGVAMLNRALLRHHYGVADWSIPPGYLCPPIPGRVDYIHHLADLLGNGVPAAIPRGPAMRVLDIGVGANCIYPILGVREYGWRFVGTEIDPAALTWATRLVAADPGLAGRIELRLQRSPSAIFAGIAQAGERFALSMCNPPFHASAAEAAAGTLRKLRNLAGRTIARPVLNFGGQQTELWCAGGETGFVRRMIAESAARPELCQWFTTLISKRDSLPPIYRALHAVNTAEVRTIDLAHGQKKSRIVAWRFR